MAVLGNKVSWLLLACGVAFGQHTSVLTVQEAIYTGGFAGANRTDDPMCVGVAIPDSWGITSTSSLGLTGATAGQFRAIGVWPSGNYKWVKTCAAISSITGGSTASMTFSNSGSGDFGGSNLATDNGTTITVATGSATFTVKKANFNGLDIVDVGLTHIVLTGTSQGFTAYGPNPAVAYPGNVTCLPNTGGTDCSVATGTLYSSANDSGANSVIVENGPAMAMIKSTWTYKDSGGTHSYFKGMCYTYFYKNKSFVRVVPVLLNADYGSVANFNASFKQIQGAELRLTTNVSGTQNITVANYSGTPTTATMSGSDDIVLYQGLSTVQQFEDNVSIYPYTANSGFTILKNGGTTGLTGITSGTSAQSPEGWGDVRDSGGVGVEIGSYWLGPVGSKSLEFASGGTSVRVGILAPQNTTRPYTLEWPAWIHENDIYLNFHATSLAAPSTDFNKWQSYLIARQPIADYNTANVFAHPLIAASVQDSLESGIYSAALPATISGGNAWAVGGVTNGTPTDCPGTNTCPNIVRDFSWNLESDYRWDYLMTWIQRGWAARYVQAAHFFDFQAQYAYPHSDGFHWYDHWDTGFTEVDNYDNPRLCTGTTCQNDTLGLHGNAAGSGHIFDNHNWHDQEHNHTWGQFDYYHLSGDEYQKDALESQKNWYLATNVYQNGGYPASTELTTVNGNSTITMTCCGSFITKNIGAYILAGSSGLKTAYQILSVTDTTHVVVSPTPTVSATHVSGVITGGLFNSRSVGSNLIVGARFSEYLQEIGDSDYTGVQDQLKNLYNTQVKSEVCNAGFLGGCNIGTLNDATTWNSQGVSRKRGFHWGSGGGSGTWCGISQPYRVNSAFQNALVTEGLLELRRVLGTAWGDDYWVASDFAYGISQFGFSEMFVDTGDGTWINNGWRFGFALDFKNDCTDASNVFVIDTNGVNVHRTSGPNFTSIQPSNTVGDTPHIVGLMIINGVRYQVSSITDADNLILTSSAGVQTGVSMHIQEVDYQFPSARLNVMQLMYAKWVTDGKTDWTTKYGQTAAMDMGISGISFRDYLGHYATQAEYLISNPGTKTLQTLTISTFTDHSDGTYTIGWTTPASTDYLRVKYAPSQIVELIGFDPDTNSFTGNSANTNWFAATNASSIPSPVTGVQSMVVTTGTAGMSSSMFSVKAFSPTVAVSTNTTGSTSGAIKIDKSIRRF